MVSIIGLLWIEDFLLGNLIYSDFTRRLRMLVLTDGGAIVDVENLLQNKEMIVLLSPIVVFPRRDLIQNGWCNIYSFVCTPKAIE